MEEEMKINSATCAKIRGQLRKANSLRSFFLNREGATALSFAKKREEH